MAEDDAGATIAAVLGSAARALTASTQTPRLDAELLMAEVLGVDRARLILRRDEVLPGDVQERFDRLARRRLDGEPVAYLLGRRAFRWIELSVDSRVLVPRPETELLVEVGLGLPPGSSVLDVGTGSGAIALALKQERPDLLVQGVDVSADAVAVAEENARNLRLDVSFRVGDLIAGDMLGEVDAVLANLPYVADDAPLPRDVARYEPGLALFGGPDGLRLIRRLVQGLADRPRPSLLGLEIGEDQGPAVRELVAAAGFREIEVRPDLGGRDRIVVGRR